VNTPGVFVTFEGPEGAGKSTQVRLLAERLRQEGYSVLTTREPGGTPLGERVRAAVLDPGPAVAPVAEFLLFSASRAQLVQDVIRPALSEGQVVICDRFADSSLAYQGYGRGLNLEFLREVTWEATGGLRPHLTVLLDVDPRVGLARATNHGAHDRIEMTDLQFHNRVREGFLQLAAGEPERFLVVDAATTSLDAEHIASVVSGVVLATVSAAMGAPSSEY
jgi:dTMP kinase